MTKMRLRVFAFVFLSICASATTTVTGTIRGLGTATVSSGTFVRLWLRGCSGNQPTVNGTALFPPTGSGPQYYIDFAPNASGVVSGSVYSTRDAAGTGNGEISCGGSLTAVWYGVQIWNNGRGGVEIPVHAKNSATLDVTQLSPISSTPVVTAPTGDSTYLRVDTTNSPLTGTLQSQNVNPAITATYDLGSNTFKYRDGWFSRNLTTAKLNSARFADQFGTTQLALTDAGTTGAVVIPSSYALTDANLKNSAGGYPSNVAMLDFRNGKVSVGPGGIGTVPHISDGTSDIPLGPDLFLFAQGAADIFSQALKTSTTSSTNVGSTGIATITVGTTANFYSGNGTIGGAAIAINRFAADWETLQPASSGCPASPSAGQYCIASLTTITASFQKTHTSTPYSVDQWGANFIQGWLTRWIDSSGNVLLSVQTTKEGASTGIVDLYMADSNVRWFEARRSDSIPRFYGKSGSSNGAIVYGSSAGAGTSGPIVFENNDTDSTAQVVIDTATGKVLTAAGAAVFGGGASSGGSITADWGISRDNPADIDFGDGTAASKVANLRFKAFILGETTTGAGTAGVDSCGADSTAHAIKCSYNGDGPFSVTRTIGSGTATMTTGAIGSLACGTTVTVGATGVATTDAISWSFNAAPAANPGELTVSAWPTANNVNFQYCNPTAGSVTPNAATLNWRVTR